MSYKLLIINPGSTSTKIGVYEDEKSVIVETLRHSAEKIGEYETIYDQFEFRKDVILSVLKERNFDVNTLNAVVGRGGMLKPVPSGTYTVNEAMLEDLKIGIQGQHASNLGGIIANEIAKSLNIPAFIVDPVVVDELVEYARLSGIPEIPRKSKFHALNQKAVAKRYARENGNDYKDLNLIVVHMGGGISVGAHCKGRIIDVNNAIDGEGPFSPERSGAVPVLDIINMCFSGKYTHKEMYKKVVGQGGFVGYAKTNDCKYVVDKAQEGDKDLKLVYDAFIYQIAKTIGQFAVTLEGKVDAILLTGGIAYDKLVTKDIADKVSWISKVAIFPGEDELLALAQGAIRVLSKKEEPKEYK